MMTSAVPATGSSAPGKGKNGPSGSAKLAAISSAPSGASQRLPAAQHCQRSRVRQSSMPAPSSQKRGKIR